MMAKIVVLMVTTFCVGPMACKYLLVQLEDTNDAVISPTLDFGYWDSKAQGKSSSESDLM